MAYLHLLYSGKKSLAKDFYFNINIVFTKLHIPSYLLSHIPTCYLNINSARNKIIEQREIANCLELDYFGISKSKIDESFPSREFAMDKFEIMARKEGTVTGVVL